MVFTAVCLSVYLHDISKTDAARITKLDIQMFHDESWKPIYFGFKRSTVKAKSNTGQSLDSYLYLVLSVKLIPAEVVC